MKESKQCYQRKKKREENSMRKREHVCKGYGKAMLMRTGMEVEGKEKRKTCTGEKKSESSKMEGRGTKGVTNERHGSAM